MKFLTLASIVLPAVLAVPHWPPPRPSRTPACSKDQAKPCACPSDFYYYDTTSMAILGASMKDSRDLLNDFYGTAWYDGTLPNTTKGPDNTPGSIRTFDYLDSTGINAAFSELLTGFNVFPDGSFLQQYQQYITPEAARNGSVPGFYVRLSGYPTFIDETVVTITAWGCWQGEHPTLTASHEYGLNNAISILKSKGKLTGVTPTNFLSTAWFAA